MIEFLYGPLAGQPFRVGRSLRDDFKGEWSARRGSYRVLYRIDAEGHRGVVTRIGHRADVYRPR